MVKLQKALDTFTTGPDGKKTDTRFIRLESDELDYNISIAIHKLGYIDIRARIKKSTLQCGGTVFGTPEIFIRENADCEPLFAETSMLGIKLCEVDIPDYELLLQRMQKNLHAVNAVIKTVNAGEKFLEKGLEIC